MYAKKPREPGTEQVKPAKRRSKKKELLTSQLFVQEMIEDTPPKINIIRYKKRRNSFLLHTIYIHMFTYYVIDDF